MKMGCRRIMGGIIVVAMLLIGSFPAAATDQDQPLQQGRPSSGTGVSELGVRLQTSTITGAVLELTVPDFRMDEVRLDGQRYVLLSAPGLDDGAVPGRPRLPQAGALVGLPPTGGWSVRILEMDRQTINLDRPVAPASSIVSSSIGPAVLQTPPARVWTGDETIYGGDAFYPSSPVEVGESFLLRDLRAVRLGLHPLRYNPVRGELEHIRRLVVEVHFDHPAAGMPPEPDAWEPVLEQAIINYDVARGWRGVHPLLSPLATNPPATTSGSFKVEVEADGLYQLTYEALQAVEFPVDAVNPEKLHLMVGGQEVAIHMSVGTDGVFGPGDRLLFYGQAARSRYTGTNIYWLFSDGIPGLRMNSHSVTPIDIYPVPSTRWVTDHFEENLLYDSLHPEASGDHWYWSDLAFLQTGCPEAVQTYLFDLPQLRTGGYNATLRTSMQGYTYSTHNFKVKLNGQHVGDIIWEGPSRMESQFALPAGWLRSTDNTLRLENGDCPPPPPPFPPPNGVAFNYFEVGHLVGYEAIDGSLDFEGQAGNQQYAVDGFSTSDLALLDITDPTLPIELTGARWGDGRLEFQDESDTVRRYLAVARSAVRAPRVYRDNPSDLASPSTPPDYLLIGYGEFLPATQPLVELRRTQGLDVMSVDVEDVYDEFSYGLLDPRAIREFLAVTAGWRPQPDFVLLVGDGTIDFLDHLGNGWHNFLPAYPAYVDLHLGPEPAETASDRGLDPGSPLPRYMMGRLPVTTLEQTRAVITKIVDYETASLASLWARRLLFVADNDDNSGPFSEYSDQIYESLSEPLLGERVYLAVEPTQSHEYDTDDPAALERARAEIRNRFKAGRLLVTYLGHSSHSQWAQEILLHRDDVPDLQNDGNWPVVLSMTCYTGAFHHPYYAPLDERLVAEPGGGAVAAWTATGAGVATGHRYLARGFLDAVQGEDPLTLGAATHAGLSRLYKQAPTGRDLIDTFVLLGDPAMRLKRFTGTVFDTYLPLVTGGP